MSGYGFAGHIGFAKESSGGTAVAATNYIEALSENIAEVIERFDVKNIVGRYAEPDDMGRLHRVSGDVSFPAIPEELGFFLRGCLGIQSNAQIVSGLHTHNFTMRTSDFDTAFAQDPYTFEISRDVTSAQQITGCNIAQLAFSASPNQDLRISMSLIGKAVTNITATSPTFTTSPTDPFAFDTCSISIGGAANAKLEGLNLTINNQLNGIARLNNSTTIAAIRRSGPHMVRLSGNIAFEDIEEYLDFKNQTEVAMKFSFFRANSFHLEFDLPRVIYTSFPLGMSGRDRQVVGFDAMARFHTGSNEAIQINLTNTTSGY